VRGGTRWEGAEVPPKQREYTASDIKAVEEKLLDIEAELFKQRRAITAHDAPASD